MNTEITSHIPTNPDWAEAIATAILATGIGNKGKTYTVVGTA